MNFYKNYQKKIKSEGDIGGHIGKINQKSRKVNEGWDFGERNETRENILDFKSIRFRYC